jgi:DNA-directed RNA polymerase beta' subunit
MEALQPGKNEDRKTIDVVDWLIFLCIRGDYDGDEINLHLPQGVHVTAELQHIMSVSEQIVTGQSGSPVVKLIQDAVVIVWLSYHRPLRQLHLLWRSG